MQKGYHSKPPVINNMVFIWFASKGKRSIVFIDTSNIGVRSVAALGQDMGYEKGNVNFDNVDHETLLEYCIRDVEIIGQFTTEYIKFLREHNLGNFKLTLASQSLQAYRTRFNNNDIYIHMWYDALVLERDAYYGGRTECFILGDIQDDAFYYLDVNSMYPYVMKNMELPTKLYKRINYPTIEDLIEYDDYYLIADVTLNTEDNVYPLRLTNDKDAYNYLNNPSKNSPYPQGKHRRLIFPTGRFRTTLHDVEIKHALDNDDIIKIHRLVVYERGKPFKDYVEFFYKLKREYTEQQNKSWRLVSKLFLNSLYGKFGQLLSHRENLETDNDYKVLRETHYNAETEEHYAILFWYGKAIREYKRGETAFSSPAIAGAITAYARYVLYMFIEQAGKENVYYTDTDSIMTNAVGYNNLKNTLDDYELGKLSLEKQSDSLIIHGNKDYKFGDDTKLKGVPRNAKPLEENSWIYIQFEGFISWFNKGGTTGMVGERRIKRRLGEYHKGIVLDNGLILPYRLFEK